MDEPQTPPSDQPQQTAPVAPPPPEQAAPTPATDAAPATDAGLMRAFTQSQQKLSAVASALGIAKTSSQEQFLAAINDRRQAIATADAELETDPRLAARAAAIRAREEQLARQQYGASADLTATLLDAARAGTGLLELTELVDQRVIEAAAARFAGSPAQAGGTPEPQPQTPQGQAPERRLDMEVPNGSAGMFTPDITPDRATGPQGYFAQLAQKVPQLRSR